MRNGLTPSRGAHVVIEYASELPNVISEGISVAPGAETMVSMKMSEIGRLKQPFGTCVDDILDKRIQKMYPPSFKYSAKSCNAFCFIVNTIEVCNCTVETEIGGVLLEKYDELNENNVRCESNSTCKANPESWFQNCSCSAECNDTIYHVI